MFKVNVSGNCAHTMEKERITSDSVGLKAHFEFEPNTGWEGLIKQAIFANQADQAGKRTPAVIDLDGNCEIPASSLYNYGGKLYVGIRGELPSGERRMVTTYTDLGRVLPGAGAPDEPDPPPTPNIVTEIQGIAQAAEDIAQSVRDDADAGRFNGKPGEPGLPGKQGPPGKDSDVTKAYVDSLPLTIKSDAIPEITDEATLRQYFYEQRKSPKRKWQFEVSSGKNENIVTGLGGRPDGVSADESAFIYIELPYSEAGGFVIRATYLLRNKSDAYEKLLHATYSTPTPTWHDSGWYNPAMGGSGGGITVKDAKVGQLIRAKAVDATGNITEYEPVPWGYGELTAEGVLLNKQDIVISDHSADITVTAGKILSGDIVTILWADQTYISKAIDYAPMAGSVMFGNLSFYALGPDTGEPFLIVTNADGSGSIVTTISDGSINIEISYKRYQYRTLPRELAPSGNSITVFSGWPETWTDEEYKKYYELSIHGELLQDSRGNTMLSLTFLPYSETTYSKTYVMVYSGLIFSGTFDPDSGNWSYQNPIVKEASEYELGGAKANPATAEDTQDVHIDENGFLKTSPGVRLEKLWENASPTAHFVAQTLKLDFSDAKFVIIINKVKDDTEVFNTSISINGKENRAFVIWGDANASRSNTITNNSIEFSTGSYLYTGSSHSSYAKGTGYCIPIEIYKVVL